MTRRHALFPGTAARDWRMTVAMPAAAAPATIASSCACNITEVRWAPDGGTELTMGDEDEMMIVAAGTVCHDTEWTLEVEWSEEGGEPVIVQLNAGAWKVTGAGEAGTLSITPTALCNGQTLEFGALVLHLEAEA